MRVARFDLSTRNAWISCQTLLHDLRSITGKIGLLISASMLLSCTATAQGTGSPTFTTAWPVALGFVNVSNGNLHLEIPLGGFPQRGGHTLTAKLVYDSRIWQQVFNGTTTVWQPTNVANSQGGWRFITSGDPGQVIYSVSAQSCDPGPGNWATYDGFTWIAPDIFSPFLRTPQNAKIIYASARI